MREEFMSDRLGFAGLTAAVALAAAMSRPSPASADAIADFYKGKTINFYIGSAPAGGYDTYGRLVVRALGKHIPGHPEVLPRNMPGGSSRVAASYVYNVAPKDGLALGMVNQELPLAQALGETLQFDAAKFNWIGTPDTDNRVVVTLASSGVKTIEDAKKKEVVMGGSGPVEASGYPEMLNTIVGTKFKTVKGYVGGNAIYLAMERGEVDGRADNAWESWKGDRGEWVRDGKVNVLVQVGLAKAPDLPNVPLLVDLARTDEDREVLKLISSSTSMGHPVIAPPGVPDDRVKALRAAFDAAMRDPVVLADAKRQRRSISPVKGEELQKIVADVLASPQTVRDRALALTQDKKPQ
jgi:tripartite-type tricarboxylate transporter receptor subunit TctC